MKRGRDLLEAIDKSGTLKVRSSMRAWMRENREAFAARLTDRIADWNVLAKMFADAGLTDRSGNPPKPETARKTWQRVRKEAIQKPSSRVRPPRAEAAKPAKSVEPAAGDDLLRVMAEMSAKSGKLPDPLK